MKFIIPLLTIFVAVSEAQAQQNPFLVLSHNVSKGQSDFNNVVSYLKKKNLLDPDAQIDQPTREGEGFEKVLMMKPDVILLQELGKKFSPPFENRHIFNLLEQNPGLYELVWFEGKNSPDSAVLLKSERFKLIKNLSFNLEFSDGSGPDSPVFARDGAIVHVQDLTNQNELVFVSAYVPGLNVKNPEPERVWQGDQYLEHIWNVLKENRLTHLNTVMGGDMNANEAFLKGHSNRFDDLKKRGFQLFWTKQNTNVNMTKGQELTEGNEVQYVRNIDLMAYRPGKKGLVSGFFSSLGFGGSLPILEPQQAFIADGFQFNSPYLFSDHLPLLQEYCWQ